MKSMIKVVRAVAAVVVLMGLSMCSQENAYQYAYMNPDLAPEERAIDLVNQMTLQEKVSQMKYDAPAVPRLGIPRYNWWNECLHGVGRAGVSTVFPQGIGMGATWDVNLMSNVATVISDEARAKHHKFISENKRGIYQGLTFWTPNINIFRDPRWGRGQETYGEDPYLTSRMGVEFIKGLQGDDPKYLKVVATAKHFAVHSGPEKSRHEDNYQTSDKDLKETYLPAFKSAIKEANVQSVMCAYNRYRDEACCGSNLLLTNILRNEWGFDGYVVSDCWAINDFYMPNRHGVSDSPEEASALAVKSGTDLNCGDTYDPNLSEAVLKELIDESEVDQALVRLMAARFKLGMFDDESLVPYASIPYSVVASEKHHKLSKKAALESMVLLKNEGNLLPLSKEVSTVAVIGPNANDKQSLLGNYHGTPVSQVTPYQGIKSKLPNAKVIYAKGSAVAEGWPLLTPIPSQNLRSGEKNGLKGEYFPNEKWEGDPSISRTDETVDFVWLDRPIKELATDTFTVRWTGQLVADQSGTYRIGFRACNVGKVYINGELRIDFQDDHHPTMKYYDMELTAGQSYDIKIDYYNFHADPQAQLLWAKLNEDLLTPAVAAAQQADVVVMCLGLTPDIEGEEMPVVLEGFDSGDRSDIQLPASQRKLLKAIYQLNKPTVVVLMNGSALAVNFAAENVPAILEAWYPGEFGGEAIADVLFGDYNPGGKLPVTFYKSTEDLPDFKTYDMTNRTYKYFEGAPLFPFGHGLSYTSFAYDQFDVAETKAGDVMTVSVSVTNTGDRAGEEVVQLYVSNRKNNPNAAKRSLVGFERIVLEKGQSQNVSFEISAEQYAQITQDGQVIVEPGELEVIVGGKQPGFEGVADAKSSQVLTKTVNIL
ncbi:beta-glucosidase [Reichenbachiella agariperforans]|uniref:Beta-glucosidase n=1 Tax=Reichenbachiella agariperforans TaxID=156994 RepID=A0A1M6LSU9_REIAG|nr:glycoside hydrolase family 3 C-terminal domain-containing protein [Reichenbachiella agariperforans]SHJ74235.1 beta-glucosidase [Reichenbachiella agariperforans]